MMPASDHHRPNRALGGLLIRRERWGLSAVGTIILVLGVGALGLLGLRRLYPFLAVTQRVATDVLVIDGWLSTPDLNQAAAEYHQGHYSQVLVVRAVYEFETIDHDPGNAGYVARVLVHAGVPADRIQTVLFDGFQRDRTYFSAKAIGEWFRQAGRPLTALNLATLGPHIRRSRLLYQKALGERVEIGVIALDDPAYDPRHWWRFSEGIREVLFEGVAYVYVRCIFTSPESGSLRLLGPGPQGTLRRNST